MIERLLFHARYGMMSRLRVAFYRALGMRIGRGCRLERVRLRRPAQIQLGAFNALTEGCWLWPADAPYNGVRIEIGDRNYFNRGVMIDSCGSVRIGDHNMIGPGVYIADSNHRMELGKWVGDCPMETGRVVIGNGCWIGAKAIILSNVMLGDRCIVGAGAVVTKSFPAGSVIAGVPAQLMRQQ